MGSLIEGDQGGSLIESIVTCIMWYIVILYYEHIFIIEIIYFL